MITSETTCTIACDKCGRQIAAGERWYSVSHSVTTSIFSGEVANLEPVAEHSMQLCEADYAASQKELEAFAPTVQTIEAAPVPVPPAV